MPESLEDHHRQLVSEEDGSIFLLIVATGEARAGRRPVSIMCVRGDAADADTDTRPMYGCVVNGLPLRVTWAATPASSNGHGLWGAGTIPPMWTWKTHGILYPPTRCTGTSRRFTWKYALSS